MYVYGVFLALVGFIVFLTIAEVLSQGAKVVHQAVVVRVALKAAFDRWTLDFEVPSDRFIRRHLPRARRLPAFCSLAVRNRFGDNYCAIN